MTQYEGPEGEAVAAAREAGVPPAAINPALLSEDGVEDAGVELAQLPLAQGQLLVRHATSPAVVVLAVTDGERTHRVRIGADPASPTVETGEAGSPADLSLVRDAEPAELLDIVAAALPHGGETGDAFTAPPLLTQESEHPALELTEQQQEQAARWIADGLSAADALDRLPDLDERLRDALHAEGPRVSLSTMLNDPLGRVAEHPVAWARIWVHGRLGLYRSDPGGGTSERPGGLRVQPVAPGDVLGSVVPILQEAMRFTAEVQRAARSDEGKSR